LQRSSVSHRLAGKKTYTGKAQSTDIPQNRPAPDSGLFAHSVPHYYHLSRSHSGLVKKSSPRIDPQTILTVNERHFGLAYKRKFMPGLSLSKRHADKKLNF
jgi:hypothetical protein